MIAIDAKVAGFKSEQLVNEVALEKELRDLKKQIKDETAITEADQRKRELEQIREHYRELRNAANQNGLDVVEINSAMREALAMKNAEFDQADLQRKRDVLKAEQDLEQERRDARQETFDNLIALAGSESKFGRAMLLAKSVMAVREMAIEASKTIAFSAQAVARSSVAAAEGQVQTAKIGFPQNIPMLIGYAAQIGGIVSALKSANAAAKQAARKNGGTGGGVGGLDFQRGAAVSAPSFNVVGRSQSNQLAEAIAGVENKPIKTYVVASDVTSGQELDRNIITSSSIG